MTTYNYNSNKPKYFSVSDTIKSQLAHELLKITNHNANIDLVQYKQTLFITQQIVDAQSRTIHDLQHQNEMLTSTVEKYKRLYYNLAQD